jgi:hypothetical protein
MIKGLLWEGGVPSLVQATGIDGPTLGYGTLFRTSHRVLVRSEHAEVARRLLAEIGEGEAEGEDWESTANAEHLADASGRGPRNYGLIGGYARIFFWSFLSFGVVTGIYFLLHG